MECCLRCLYLIFSLRTDLLQPDIGTATIIAMIAGTVIISSGMSIKSIMKLFGIAIDWGLALSCHSSFCSSEDIFTRKQDGENP